MRTRERIRGAADPALNPDGIPTWFEWKDMDDTIVYEQIFGGDIDQVMAYAFCYVENTTGDPMEVDIGLASDDAVQVLLNGDSIHVNSIARDGGAANEIQDVIPDVTLEAGLNTVMVKVFEIGGGHDFRLRFQDPSSHPITEGLRILLSPPGDEERPIFRRGDVDASGTITIGDAVYILNHMFADGPAPSCPDTADVDDSGSYTIGDAIWHLNYQFVDGQPPVAPGPNVCGPDPTDNDPWPDETCVYEPAANPCR